MQNTRGSALHADDLDSSLIGGIERPSHPVGWCRPRGLGVMRCCKRSNETFADPKRRHNLGGRRRIADAPQSASCRTGRPLGARTIRRRWFGRAACWRWDGRPFQTPSPRPGQRGAAPARETVPLGHVDTAVGPRCGRRGPRCSLARIPAGGGRGLPGLAEASASPSIANRLLID